MKAVIGLAGIVWARLPTVSNEMVDGQDCIHMFRPFCEWDTLASPQVAKSGEEVMTFLELWHFVH